MRCALSRISTPVCREIVRRRRSMEYKLQRRPVRLEDFLRAITVSWCVPTCVRGVSSLSHTVRIELGSPQKSSEEGILVSCPSPHSLPPSPSSPQRLGVTSARRDAEFGIQDRVHSLFKVLQSPSLGHCSVIYPHIYNCRERSRDSRLLYHATFSDNIL